MVDKRPILTDEQIEAIADRVMHFLARIRAEMRVENQTIRHQLNALTARVDALENAARLRLIEDWSHVLGSPRSRGTKRSHDGGSK